MRLFLSFTLCLFAITSNANEHMNQIIFKQFNLKGQKENSISADKLVYSETEIVVSMPKILQNNWQLTAQSATMTPEFKIITFNHNVIILDKQDPTLRIETEKLQYIVAQKLFVNEEYVTFEKNHMKMSGTGLRANLPENKIKILRNVRTSLEVN